MARIANYVTLFFVMAMFAIVTNQSFSGAAFADSNQNRAQAKATAQVAEQEQALILEEMKANAHPHATDLPGLIHK
jgi:hypothetical protein